MKEKQRLRKKKEDVKKRTIAGTQSSNTDVIMFSLSIRSDHWPEIAGQGHADVK